MQSISATRTGSPSLKVHIIRYQLPLTLLCASFLGALLPTTVQAENIFGLTNQQQIITFDSQDRIVTNTFSPAGFSISGEFLLGIDIRPATGQLYGLSNQNNIFVIDPITGASTQIGASLSPPTTAGFYKAIDFNPTVDRIRVIDSNGNNLRVHPDTGFAIDDGALAFSPGDANEGDAPFVVNGAYTNSFAGATTTTLYDIEAGNDILSTQTPANDGSLQTVGALGFDVVSSSGFTGFDISGTTGDAFLVGNALFGTGNLAAGSLYQVNLGTGQASLLGTISGVNGILRDIAVISPAAVPEPASIWMGIYGLLSLGFFWRRYRNSVA